MSPDGKAIFEGGRHMISANKVYDSAEQIEEEIDVLESAIKGTRERICTARVSSSRYFWPFLVLSILTFIGMWIYSEVNGLLVYAREGATAASDFKATTMFMAFLVFFFLHVFGGAIARHFRDKRNGALEMDELNKKATIKKCENRIVELKAMQKKIIVESAKVPMTKEELDSKKNELAEVEKTIEISNAELIKVRKKMPKEYYDSMKFFWPFLVSSFAVQSGVFIFGGGLLFYRLGIEDGALIALAASAVVFALFHIFGGIYARKKTASANNELNEKRDALNIEEKRLRDILTEFNLKKMKLTKEIEQGMA